MKRSTFIAGSVACAAQLTPDQAFRQLRQLEQDAAQQKAEDADKPRRERIAEQQRLVEFQRRLDAAEKAIGKVRGKDTVNVKDMKQLRRSLEAVLAFLK